MRVSPSAQDVPSSTQPPSQTTAALPLVPPGKPLVNAPSGKDYRVGPGDVLAIRVYDEPDLTQQVRVAESGILSFPLIDSVEVKNLTTAEIEKRLEEALSPRFLLNPQVFVSVAQFESKKVFIVGAVDQPTAFTLRGETTLLEVLSHTSNLSHSSFLIVFRRTPVTDSKQDSPRQTM